jgi:hypothetical protein
MYVNTRLLFLNTKTPNSASVVPQSIQNPLLFQKLEKRIFMGSVAAASLVLTAHNYIFYLFGPLKNDLQEHLVEDEAMQNTAFLQLQRFL